MPLAKLSWRPLPYSIPPVSGVVGIKVNDQWYYICRSTNLSKGLKATSHPYKIAQSLDAHHVSFWYARATNNQEAKRMKLDRIKRFQPIGIAVIAIGNSPDYSPEDRAMPSIQRRITAHGPFCRLIDPPAAIAPHGVIIVE